MSVFSKATDRFVTISDRRPSPGPGRYSPLASIGKEITSTLSRAPRAKIGSNKLDVLDIHFSMKAAKEVPGPGNYERFSDFGPLKR